MKIYSELEFAQLENSASDPTTGLALGRIYFNTSAGQPKYYNGTGWVFLGSGSGGGGAGGLTWTNEGPTAALMQVENGQTVFTFAQSLSQLVKTVVRVPKTFQSGNPVKAYVMAYSPSASGNFLLQANVYLIRTGTDAFSSTTLTRTTTNAALTNTVANQSREVALDITDVSGKIGGTLVSAGDTIRLELFRGSDTDTGDIRSVAAGTEVTFT